jgi:hypothetical protein
MCTNVLVGCTRSDIAFAVNVLARFGAKLTKRLVEWCQTYHAIPQTHGGSRLFNIVREDSNIKGYVDVGYVSVPHQGKSHTCYVFLKQGATISWKSTKQSLEATSSTHS